MIPGKCNTLTSRQCWDLDPSIPLVLRCHSTPRSNFFVISVLVFFAYHGTVTVGWSCVSVRLSILQDCGRQLWLNDFLSPFPSAPSMEPDGREPERILPLLPHLFGFCFPVHFSPYTPSTRWVYLHVSAALRFYLVSTQGRSGSSSVTEGEIGHSYTIPPMFSLFS